MAVLVNSRDVKKTQEKPNSEKLREECKIQEEELQTQLDLKAEELKNKILNEKTRVLRKLWDMPIKDAIALERETPDFNLSVLLKHIKNASKE